MPGVAPVNTGDPELEYAFYEAERRVLEIQAKLHRWARDDPHRRFDDLYNLEGYSDHSVEVQANYR